MYRGKTEIRKRIRKKHICLDGYMTLEASFIIPLTFICFIIILLYTFFLYNHLVVYQSCYISALRGSQVKNATTDAIKKYVDEQATKLLEEQVYQYQIDHTSDVSALSIKVNAVSKVTNLMSKFDLYKEGELVSNRGVSVNRINPVDYIRNAQRFQ